MDANLLTPQTLFFALAGGILPALLWLWFWLKEDRLHPEPKSSIVLSFVAGMIAVPLVIPLQNFLYGSISSSAALSSITVPALFLAWAAAEETFKFTACYIVVLRGKEVDEPIDAVIYLLTTALGFAALENSLFLLNPLIDGDIVTTLVTGNLRFMGATLLHLASSSIIGVFLAFSFFRPRSVRRLYIAFGLVGAIALHTLFNLFIIKSTGSASFAFMMVWVAIIILIVLFQKIKRLKIFYAKR